LHPEEQKAHEAARKEDVETWREKNGSPKEYAE
jgi:hypothetical protein